MFKNHRALCLFVLTSIAIPHTTLIGKPEPTDDVIVSDEPESSVNSLDDTIGSDEIEPDEPISPPHSKDDAASNLDNTQSPLTPFDGLVNDIKKQLGHISLMLSSLSGMISNRQVNTIKDKDTALKNIKNLNHLVQNIQQEKFIQPDLQTLDLLLHFCQAVMQHILRSLEQGFIVFKAFDPTPVFKRQIPIDKSDQEILRSFQTLATKNAELAVKLLKKTDEAGLYWYNKAYRVFDRLVIDPCNKYSIPQRTALAVAAAGVGLWAWWRLGHETFKAAWGGEREGSLYKSIWGPLPDLNRSRALHGAPDIDHEQELGAVGKIDKFLFEINHSVSPIGTILGGWAAAMAAKEVGEHIKPKASRWLTEFHNRMMGGAYLKEARKAAERAEDVTFKDLVGLDHVKKEFKLLVDYLESPESFDRLDVTPSKGILLVGETRTGKSFSVKALFGEINRMLARSGQEKKFAFIELPATLINNMGIPYWLEKLKKKAPCIVFIDEIDLLGLQRQGKNETLSEFLTCMSGTIDKHDPKHQIIIIAATNRPENMDEALRQPGRFGKEIRFEYPSYQDRLKFIVRKLEKLSLNTEQFDTERLARETENKSYEALNILINHAVLKARIAGEGISQEHFEQTLDAELRHIISSDNKELPDHEKEIIATHFAGRVVALELLDTKQILSKVTIQKVMTTIKEEPVYLRMYNNQDTPDRQKRFDYGALFTTHAFDTSNVITHDEKLKQIKCHLAGFVAEEILFGQATYSCHPEEHDRALALAKSITFQGLDEKKLPKKIVVERSDKALEILNKCEQEVHALLNDHIDDVVAITHALQNKETLSAQEVKGLMSSISLPEASVDASDSNS